MRVLFDGYWWSEGPHANREVQRDLILAWERAFAEDSMVVAVPGRAVADARRELPSRVEVAAVRLRPHGISVITELPSLHRRTGADVMVAHNFTPRRGPSAVFVHDLLFETNPEWFTAAERRYFSLMTRTLPRAAAVATSSRTEAERIARVVDLREAVRPIGLAVPSSLADAAPRPVPELAGLDELALVVGRLNVRKNLATVLRAAARAGSVTPRRPLVVVGEGAGRRAAVPDDARPLVEAGAIRLVGAVSAGELAWLYGRAHPFVFMSLGEGFGLPALEALHFGAPIVASDIPVFREILGERARLVAPSDVAAMAAAIDAAAARPRPAPADVAALGWSWDASARRLRAAAESAAR